MKNNFAVNFNPKTTKPGLQTLAFNQNIFLVYP